jgi:hypothetical protein
VRAGRFSGGEAATPTRAEHILRRQVKRGSPVFRKEHAMLSRRELIGKAAVGAAAALAVGGVVGTAVAATRPLRDATDDPVHPKDDSAENRVGLKDPVPPPDGAEIAAPPPWTLVAPYSAGSVVAHDWRLVDLGPVQAGSAVATLQNARGRAQRVHLCRNDGNPQGVVYTRRVDLVVMNEGYGDLPTEERFGQAVAALAHAVAANEGTVADDVLAGLVPHAERVQRYAAATDALAGRKLR